MSLIRKIPQTVSTPLVTFDPETAELRISGESYPENSFEFYEPISKNVAELLSEGDRLNLVIDISYMNSSSTKCVLDLLDLLEEAHGKGAEVSVVWHYDKDNPRSLDLAEEFKEEFTLPFHIVQAN